MTQEHFESLKAEFKHLFESIQGAKVKNTGVEPSYAFEQVSDAVTTFEFAGKHSEIVEFLTKLSDISTHPLPFPVEKEEPGPRE